MKLNEQYDFSETSEIITYIQDEFKDCRIDIEYGEISNSKYIGFFISQEQFIEFDIDLDDNDSAININTEDGLERFSFSNKDIDIILEAVK